MSLTITNHASALSIASGATLPVTAVSAAVGDLLVLACAADNAEAAGANSISSSVTDSAGNTWVDHGVVNRTAASAANDGVSLRLWSLKVTTALVSGTVTVNFSPDTVAKAAGIWKVTGANPHFYSAGSGTTGSSATPSTGAVPAVPAGFTVIGFVAAEQHVALTADGDTTNGSWSTRQTVLATTGTAATSTSLTSQHKTVTATGDQTYDPTLGSSRDWAANWLIVYDEGGSLSATLPATTASATGELADLPIEGVLAQTLGTLTASAAGVVPSAGTLAKTLGSLTASATGAAELDEVVGTLARTLDDLTLRASSGVGVRVGAAAYPSGSAMSPFASVPSFYAGT